VFPAMGKLDRPMSENTATAALRRMGFGAEEMTPHGFRAMASTLLNESGKWHPDAIERALAHRDSDQVRAAYHRGAHWEERVRMAQWWSDHIDLLRQGGGEVVSLHRKPNKASKAHAAGGVVSVFDPFLPLERWHSLPTKVAISCELPSTDFGHRAL